jgi:AcrR family transcriptional regulator
VKTLIFQGVARDRKARLEYEPIVLDSLLISTNQVFDVALLARAKQEAILAAASWLFNLKGVDATSLEEIAARVGVTKKVIYHNIGDKEALVVACYLRTLDFAISLLERASDYSGDRLQVFCRLIHAHAEAKLREDIATLSTMPGLGMLPDPARWQVNDAASRLLEVAMALFRAGQAENSVRDLDVGAVMSISPGAVDWIPKWLSADTAVRRSQIAREVATFCGIGLRPV